MLKQWKWACTMKYILIPLPLLCEAHEKRGVTNVWITFTVNGA